MKRKLLAHIHLCIELGGILSSSTFELGPEKGLFHFPSRVVAERSVEHLKRSEWFSL